MHDYNELKTLFRDVPKPFSFIDLDEIDRNIDHVLDHSQDKKIRIATKSIRNISVLKYLKSMLAHNYNGLMTFHIEESLYLLDNGFEHCLMGYPQKISKDQALRLKTFSKNNKKIVLMIDSIEQLQQLESLGEEIDFNFDICIDIDLSLKLPGLVFGVLRSPLRELGAFEKLFNYIKNSKRLKLNGIMGYEAQIAGVTDYSQKGFLFDCIISWLKRVSTKKIYSLRENVVNLAKSYFGELEFINGGGSGSLEMSCADKSIDEITVGSGFYCSHLFDKYKNPFSPSCFYAVEVSRKNQDNVFTLHGGGYIASGSCDLLKHPEIYLPNSLVPSKNEMFGEVQSPVISKEKIKLELGDPVFLRHAKAGELMERFNKVYIIKEMKIIDTWSTYRGDGQCIL